MIDPLVRPPIGDGSTDAAPASRRPAALDGADEPPPSGGSPRLSAVVDELRQLAGGFEPARLAWEAARLIPSFTMPRVRARLLAAVGCHVPLGTAVGGFVYLVGPRGCASRLRIGPGCILGPDVTFGLDADITLGRNVSIGPRAVLYTATHAIGLEQRRMQLSVLARPIVVEDGAWIGFGALVLPGVRVGRGAVVAAGSVVSADVPENAIVAGNPAAVTQTLPSTLG